MVVVYWARGCAIHGYAVWETEREGGLLEEGSGHYGGLHGGSIMMVALVIKRLEKYIILVSSRSRAFNVVVSLMVARTTDAGITQVHT